MIGDKLFLPSLIYDNIKDGRVLNSIFMDRGIVMLSIEGIYKNGEIILQEKPEITRPIKVIVTFLENVKKPDAKAIDLNNFSFNECREILKDYKGSLSDTVIEERREAL